MAKFITTLVLAVLLLRESKLLTTVKQSETSVKAPLLIENENKPIVFVKRDDSTSNDYNADDNSEKSGDEGDAYDDDVTDEPKEPPITFDIYRLFHADGNDEEYVQQFLKHFIVYLKKYYLQYVKTSKYDDVKKLLNDFQSHDWSSVQEFIGDLIKTFEVIEKQDAYNHSPLPFDIDNLFENDESHDKKYAKEYLKFFGAFWKQFVLINSKTSKHNEVAAILKNVENREWSGPDKFNEFWKQISEMIVAIDAIDKDKTNPFHQQDIDPPITLRFKETNNKNILKNLSKMNKLHILIYTKNLKREVVEQLLKDVEKRQWANYKEFLDYWMSKMHEAVELQALKITI